MIGLDLPCNVPRSEITCWKKKITPSKLLIPEQITTLGIRILPYKLEKRQYNLLFRIGEEHLLQIALHPCYLACRLTRKIGVCTKQINFPQITQFDLAIINVMTTKSQTVTAQNVKEYHTLAQITTLNSSV